MHTSTCKNRDKTGGGGDKNSFAWGVIQRRIDAVEWSFFLENSRALSSDISMNKVGNVRITKHFGPFVQPLLQWNSNKYYILLMCVCSLRNSACNAHTPYYMSCGLPGSTIFFHIIS
jgi:hypothetical protein